MAINFNNINAAQPANGQVVQQPITQNLQVETPTFSQQAIANPITAQPAGNSLAGLGQL